MFYGLPVYEGRGRRGECYDHRKNDNGHLAVALLPTVLWYLLPACIGERGEDKEEWERGEDKEERERREKREMRKRWENAVCLKNTKNERKG